MSTSNSEWQTLLTAVAFAVLCSFALFWLFKAIRLQRPPIIRVLAAALIFVVAIAPAGLFDYVVSMMNRTSGMSRRMVDPGWALKFAPGMIGMLIAWILNMRDRRRRSNAPT